MQKLEDEALVRPKKMQKRTEENPLEVKAEDSSDDKDDIPLAQRLEMLNSKAKNGHVKPEERSAEEDVENVNESVIEQAEDNPEGVSVL